MTEGDWKQRHLAVMASPCPGPERAMVRLVMGWVEFGESHRARYESPIGHDGVIGRHWADIGEALRGLLHAEVGRLDCGALDSLIGETARCGGVDLETGGLWQDVEEES